MAVTAFKMLFALVVSCILSISVAQLVGPGAMTRRGGGGGGGGRGGGGWGVVGECSLYLFLIDFFYFKVFCCQYKISNYLSSLFLFSKGKWPVGFFIAGSSIEKMNGLYVLVVTE